MSDCQDGPLRPGKPCSELADLKEIYAGLFHDVNRDGSKAYVRSAAHNTFKDDEKALALSWPLREPAAGSLCAPPGAVDAAKGALSGVAFPVTSKYVAALS